MGREAERCVEQGYLVWLAVHEHSSAGLIYIYINIERKRARGQPLTRPFHLHVYLYSRRRLMVREEEMCGIRLFGLVGSS